MTKGLSGINSYEKENNNAFTSRRRRVLILLQGKLFLVM